MHPKLRGLWKELPKELDHYIQKVETENLNGSNISKKHVRVLMALYSIMMEENSASMAFATVEHIQSLIEYFYDKRYSSGDIQSFAEDLCVRAYAQKIKHPQFGIIFGITEKGYSLHLSFASKIQKTETKKAPSVSINT